MTHAGEQNLKCSDVSILLKQHSQMFISSPSPKVEEKYREKRTIQSNKHVSRNYYVQGLCSP